MRETLGSPVAWEPLTPRGVAAFAGARLGRLLLAQFIVALLVAGAFVWLLVGNCFPVIGGAVQTLPATGEITSGKLDWMGDSPKLLARGRFLAFNVDLEHSGQMSGMSDLQIEFGRLNVRVISPFGYLDWPYPHGYVIAFNQNELEPLWGAWKAELLALAAATSEIGLLLSWWLLATVYFLPVWLLAFYANRNLNLRQSWRLSGAALMPGALLMAAAILLYGIGFLNLVSFLFVFVAHFVITWVYLLVSLIFLPRSPDIASKGNPFKKEGTWFKKGNPFKKNTVGPVS